MPEEESTGVGTGTGTGTGTGLPPLIYTGTDTAAFYRLNSDSQMNDGFVTITKKLYFRVPDGQNILQYSDLDVYKSSGFPEYNSPLPEDTRFLFKGNASIRHGNDAKYFTADIEYTNDLSDTDQNGNPVTKDTEPWKLRPSNIEFTYPEVKVPFEAAFGSNNDIFGTGTDSAYYSVPVRNSAGDSFAAEVARRNMEISFTYNAASSSWNATSFNSYGCSVNSGTSTVCGFVIKPKQGLLYPPNASFVTTYKNDGRTIKWQYWAIKVRILVDMTGTVIKRRFLDVGDRAFFAVVIPADELLTQGGTTAPTLAAVTKGETQPEPIFKVRPFVKVTMSGSLYSFVQSGSPLWLALSQYIQYRQAVLQKCFQLQKTDTNYVGGNVDLQGEQMHQIPLRADGTVDADAITSGKYRILEFDQYPTVDWSGIGLPQKR